MQHEDLNFIRGLEPIHYIFPLALLLVKADIADPIQFKRAFHDIQDYLIVSQYKVHGNTIGPLTEYNGFRTSLRFDPL
jgi:hypothetical protein